MDDEFKKKLNSFINKSDKSDFDYDDMFAPDGDLLAKHKYYERECPESSTPETRLRYLETIRDDCEFYFITYKYFIKYFLSDTIFSDRIIPMDMLDHDEIDDLMCIANKHHSTFIGSAKRKYFNDGHSIIPENTCTITLSRLEEAGTDELVECMNTGDFIIVLGQTEDKYVILCY